LGRSSERFGEGGSSGEGDRAGEHEDGGSDVGFAARLATRHSQRLKVRVAIYVSSLKMEMMIHCRLRTRRAR
jgi:hypothetical protein